MVKKQVIDQKCTIGLYGDAGVSPNSFFQLKKLLSPYYAIVKIKATDIISKNWPGNMRALVMPGGVDTLYHQKLQGIGCANIKAFVETGGAYVGICAGSYFAGQCGYFTYADGKIINEGRDLGFFKGRVIGPAFGTYIEEGHISARLVSITLGGGSTYQAYFNGGGFFENAKEDEILGVYQETDQPMAIQCKIGKGHAFLCAIHPEYDQEFLMKEICLKVKGEKGLEQIVREGGPCMQVKVWFLKKLEAVVSNAKCANIL